MTSEPRDPATRLLLWLVAIGFFMQTLDSTIVNTALPSMARSLGESPLRMQAVVVAYALAMATVIPRPAGWPTGLARGASSSWRSPCSRWDRRPVPPPGR